MRVIYRSEPDQLTIAEAKRLVSEVLPRGPAIDVYVEVDERGGPKADGEIAVKRVEDASMYEPHLDRDFPKACAQLGIVPRWKYRPTQTGYTGDTNLDDCYIISHDEFVRYAGLFGLQVHIGDAEAGGTRRREYVRTPLATELLRQLRQVPPDEFVTVTEQMGRIGGASRTSARDWIDQLQAIADRQAKGYFTVSEAAQMLVDANPSLSPGSLVERMRDAHLAGSSERRRLVRGMDMLPLAEDAKFREFANLVKVSEVDEWLASLGVEYRLSPLCPPDDAAGYQPLSRLIGPYADGAITGLPPWLRQRIADAFFAMPSWDELTPDQRRSLANQYDLMHDPANTAEHEYWFSLAVEIHKAESEKRELELSNPQGVPSEVIRRTEALDRVSRRIRALKAFWKLPAFTVKNWAEAPGDEAGLEPPAIESQAEDSILPAVPWPQELHGRKLWRLGEAINQISHGAGADADALMRHAKKAIAERTLMARDSAGLRVPGDDNLAELLNAFFTEDFNRWLDAIEVPFAFRLSDEPPQTASAGQPLDLSQLATRDELISAFGGFTGMSKDWFKKLDDAPALKAARKFAGRGQRRSIEPLFCPFEVMQWLVNPKRRKGRRGMTEAKGWELLEKHFPRVYSKYGIGDPRD